MEMNVMQDYNWGKSEVPLMFRAISTPPVFLYVSAIQATKVASHSSALPDQILKDSLVIFLDTDGVKYY
jgi:hypothetical protein